MKEVERLERKEGIDGSQLRLAAMYLEKGELNEAYKLVTDVRLHLVEVLRRERLDTQPCSPPFESLMKPDYENEKDKYFKS